MLLTTLNTQQRLIFGLILLIKLLLLLVCSSGYRQQLFIPFLELFLNDGGNPWQTVYEQSLTVEFPYPPVMLYLLSAFYYPIASFSEPPMWLANIAIGVPILLADLLILITLLKQLPYQSKAVLIYYFASPIILYASYLHGQLDLIPTALLVMSLHHLLKKRPYRSAIFLSLALACKLHIIAVLPLVAIYWLKRRDFANMVLHGALPLALLALLSWPYWSEGYFQLVFNNDKQQMIYDSVIGVGQQVIYLPILGMLLVYLNFLTYTRINGDLLYGVTGLLFTIVLLLVSPSPAWFIWVWPFLVIFYLRYFKPLERHYLVAFITFSYLVYFLVFFRYEFTPVLWLDQPWDMTVDYPILRNIALTALQAGLLASAYLSYRYAIASNRYYAKARILAIGIGGDSSTGKSTLLRDLKTLLGSQLLDIEGDADHRWERGHAKWQDLTHLDPKANHLHQQAAHIMTLKSGRPVLRSEYDHGSGRFSQAKAVQPRDFLVLCGLHPFYLAKMRKILDLKIFMSPDESLRRHWKIQRDSQQRGYNADTVKQQLDKRQADRQRYILPQQQFADLVISYFPLQALPIEQESTEQTSTEQAPTRQAPIDIALGLRLTLDASIAIEPLVEFLTQRGVEVQWDYSEDANSQQLVITDSLASIDYNELIYRQLPQQQDMLMGVRWASGYRGLIQVVIIFMVSDFFTTES